MMDHIRVAGPGLAAEVGWYVERDGRRLALLTDAVLVAPGFLSCRLQPLTNDPADRERLHADTFWADTDSLVLRGRDSGRAASRIEVSGNPAWLLRETGRLLLRVA